MKKLWLLPFIVLSLFFASTEARATLLDIGDAIYNNNTYNLIYENTQGLIWLDYTNSPNTWDNQVNWASGLNNTGVLNIQLNPGVSVSWNGNWRLPTTVDGEYVYGYDGTTTAGFNITTSEMGHLYYDSLGNLGYYDTNGNFLGFGLVNKGPFENLASSSNAYYWSGTEYSLYPDWAWDFAFNFNGGSQSVGIKDDYQNYGSYALAVCPADVTIPTPEPSTMLLLGLGLMGLAGVRRKFKK